MREFDQTVSNFPIPANAIRVSFRVTNQSAIFNLIQFLQPMFQLMKEYEASYSA